MRHLLAFTLFALAACGGSDHPITAPPPPKKPDPYITIRVRDFMDTTTAAGRAQWHAYIMLSGPDVNLAGVSWQGNLGLADVRGANNILCTSVAADSVGQRLVTLTAFADTTTEQATPQAQFDSFAQAWYGGNHTLPAGWMALSFAPTDAWQSAQYLAGHGLTRDDPIKWDLQWTGAGVVNFTERTDTSPQCAVAFG
jgi:hypothetical protein